MFFEFYHFYWCSLINSVNAQIEAQNRTGMEDELKEFTIMFKHCDKYRSGRLDHTEVKACLRALGFDLPVAVEGESDFVFEAILDSLDSDRDGFVRVEEFTMSMISRTTENVTSTDELRDAFRSLTKGKEKPWQLHCKSTYTVYRHPYIAICTSRLQSCTLPPDQAKYCIDRMEKYPDVSGVLDYWNFTKSSNPINASLPSSGRFWGAGLPELYQVFQPN